MSFWNTSSGENVAETATGEYSIGGNMELIPDGSTVQAYIKSAQWERNERGGMEEYINIQWKVEAPESLAGRVVFQKLWVSDSEPNALKKGREAADKKRDKALKTLANIDKNAGGRLLAKGAMPTDDDLALALLNKSMVIHVKTYDLQGSDGGKVVGNWVAEILPKGRELKVGTTPPPKVGGNSGGNAKDVLDDDIPF